MSTKGMKWLKPPSNDVEFVYDHDTAHCPRLQIIGYKLRCTTCVHHGGSCTLGEISMFKRLLLAAEALCCFQLPERINSVRIQLSVNASAVTLTRRDFVISGRRVYFLVRSPWNRGRVTVDYELQTFSQRILDRYHERDGSS